jgi:hypothetical protein
VKQQLEKGLAQTILSSLESGKKTPEQELWGSLAFDCLLKHRSYHVNLFCRTWATRDLSKPIIPDNTGKL